MDRLTKKNDKISKEKLLEIQQGNDLKVYIYKFNRFKCAFSVEEVKYRVEVTYELDNDGCSITQIRVYNDLGDAHIVKELEENDLGYQACYLEKNDENFKDFKNKTIARLEHLEKFITRMMNKFRWTLEITQAQLKELKGDQNVKNQQELDEVYEEAQMSEGLKRRIENGGK